MAFTTYYAAFMRPGSRWDPAKPVREQAYWDDHARYMDARFAEGKVVLAGPFADRTGALVIVKAENAPEVYRLYAEDPWTVHDVLVVADVKEWTIFLDGRTRAQASG
jgi:uncharacterized protein YciI